MKRVKLEVAYDGTNYYGWQRQNGRITVEEVLTRVLGGLLKEDIVLTGASRTDSGVHACGNVAVFDTNVRMPAEKISYALNTRLPDDIRIQSSCEVPLTFHPRYDAHRKLYRYRILNCTFPLPTERLYSHFMYYPLDVERMQEAASCLVGRHDFKSYCSVNTAVRDTVRQIYRINISRNENIVEIEVEGNGFLYNMVRIIVGTLIKIGTGEWEKERVQAALEARDRLAAGPTAPAKGLSLVKIYYED